MKQIVRLALVGVTGLMLGCSNYYRVTDPTTGRTYYTQELEQRSSGAAKLKDARTGGSVTLQNSEVEKISKEQFDSGRYTAPASTQPVQTAG